VSRPVRHLALVGATASGKSALAFELAQRLPDVEIVSVDSMQVYRGMDIGTDKPTAAQRAEVPHHLIDLADPDEDFTVTRFQDAWRKVRADLERRGVRALLVGGTGLYVRAIVDDLAVPGQYPEVRAELEVESDLRLLHARLAEMDPLAASRMEPTNRRRILRALEVCLGSGLPFSSFGPGLAVYPPVPFDLVGIALPPGAVADRIARRYARQMEAGFLDEVRRLRDHPAGLSRTARQALGYRQLLAHLELGVPLDAALDEAVRRTRLFARRQRVWFRRDPRIRWLQPADENPVALVPELLGNWKQCRASS
jgi:tRNA dimethylallyltransferase